MSSERPTVRPVTLGRLVEVTHLCDDTERDTESIEESLDVTHRRARETLLEAVRIGLLDESDDETPRYTTTSIGEQFLEAVRGENWADVSSILSTHSPHYGALLEAVEEEEPAPIEALLDQLEEAAEFTPHSYNQTGVEVVGAWAERLGRVNRNAFTGHFYRVERDDVPPNFPYVLLETYDELEEHAGVNLRQRYLSIPRLREELCERLQCPRDAFDEALLDVCSQNVGKLELSGAPMDTEAKESVLGIKRIARADSDGLVSTSQSSQQVMAGVEQYGKDYYYLAVHDRDITYTEESTR